MHSREIAWYELEDPVNRVPFDTLRTRFSGAIIERDECALYEVKIEAERMIKRLEVAIVEYGNMVTQVEVEVARMESGSANG